MARDIVFVILIGLTHAATHDSCTQDDTGSCGHSALHEYDATSLLSSDMKVHKLISDAKLIPGDVAKRAFKNAISYDEVLKKQHQDAEYEEGTETKKSGDGDEDAQKIVDQAEEKDGNEGAQKNNDKDMAKTGMEDFEEAAVKEGQKQIEGMVQGVEEGYDEVLKKQHEDAGNQEGTETKKDGDGDEEKDGNEGAQKNNDKDMAKTGMEDFAEAAVKEGRKQIEGMVQGVEKVLDKYAEQAEDHNAEDANDKDKHEDKDGGGSLAETVLKNGEKEIEHMMNKGSEEMKIIKDQVKDMIKEAGHKEQVEDADRTAKNAAKHMEKELENSWRAVGQEQDKKLDNAAKQLKKDEVTDAIKDDNEQGANDNKEEAAQSTMKKAAEDLKSAGEHTNAFVSMSVLTVASVLAGL